MIRSMTGFGRSHFEAEGQHFEIEARSVNHRHLDFRIRLPQVLQALEPAARAFSQERLVRGKVDLNVALTEAAGSTVRLEVDADLAAQYVKAARELAASHEMSAELDMGRLLSMPGVIRQVDEKLSGDGAQEALCGGIDEALRALQSMQEEEGEKLNAEFTLALDHVVELVDWLETRSGEVLESSREKLKQRMDQFQSETGSLDSARLHQEVVILTDRLDIREELVRLRSHVDQFRNVVGTCEVGQVVGRRLDFLLQEMGREANTVGSKANDAPIAHQVVELKTQLEKLREQVQNIA
ncbi:MAG: YicC family protein [Spirochaeta sp.]|nr:YicC family protein [Spirochaeta sp.]RPG03311.1 MAG: YicC family protein [Proteobacteria bacterium TMED72]